MQWLGVWNCIFSGSEFSKLKFEENRSFCGIPGIFLEISASEKYFSDPRKWPFHTPPIHTPNKCRPIFSPAKACLSEIMLLRMQILFVLFFFPTPCRSRAAAVKACSTKTTSQYSKLNPRAMHRAAISWKILRSVS